MLLSQQSDPKIMKQVRINPVFVFVRCILGVVVSLCSQSEQMMLIWDDQRLDLSTVILSVLNLLFLCFSPVFLFYMDASHRRKIVQSIIPAVSVIVSLFLHDVVKVIISGFLLTGRTH